MVRERIKQKAGVRRSIGRFTWNLLSYLPFFVRAPLIRRMFSVDRDLPENLVFKKAETPEEIEQAFKLAYEAYADRGLVAESEAKLRVTKYHALPTTSLLIAKLGDEVIATISIIGDSGFGLPMEKLFNIKFLRKGSKRLAEISTLAIKRGHRTQRGKLLLAVCKFMNEYCLNILGVDTIVVTVHPEVRDFYRAVLMFEDIEKGRVKQYEFVQGAAASAHYLHLGAPLAKRMEKVFNRFPENRNLFKFFHIDEIDNFIFPERPFLSAHDFTFTPPLLHEFFKQKTKIMNELSQQDRVTISNLYYYPEYRAVFGILDSLGESAYRKSARFQSMCPVKFYYVDNKTNYFQATAIEVSRHGLRIKIDNYVPPKNLNQIVILVSITKDKTLAMSAQIIWDNTDYSLAGIWLNSFVPKEWHNFINYLEAELKRAAEIQAQQKRAK